MGTEKEAKKVQVFESAEAATKHAISASGNSIKQVASALWPGKTVASATTHLANCLNEGRNERLTFDEHAFVADFCGSYQVLYYLAGRLGHSQPVLQSPADQAAQVQAALFAAADEFRGLLAKMEALKPKLVRSREA